ncbi:hypothetical protein [Nocardia grenadensis]|uniref:hypothetical protein n=1 Tax=Nocardia grenadensis TaxID=931537 RepID=UPI003D92E6EB
MPKHRDQNNILPVPVDLYEELGDLDDRICEVRAQLNSLQRRYDELGVNLESLDVDTLGRPTTPAEEMDQTAEALTRMNYRLDQVRILLDQARSRASRLKLTEEAAEHREQQINARDVDPERLRRMNEADRVHVAAGYARFGTDDRRPQRSR